jgi:hypothetical protein
MRASVPQDVDLEDHLVYGLTPTRFGYLVVAALGAMSLWGLRWLPLAARLGPGLVLLIAAALLAWGRWRGRPLDRLALDVAIFLRRNYGVRLGRARRPVPGSVAATVRFTAVNAIGRRRWAAWPGGPP